MSGGQLVQFGLQAGLAEGIDPKQAPPGTLSALRNCMRRKDGLLEKRGGTAGTPKTILSGGSIAAAARLFCRGPELCLNDGGSLYALSAGKSSWELIDKVPDVGLTWSTLLDPLAGVASTDIAIASGIVVHAWITGDPTAATTGALCLQLVDQASNTVLLAPTILSASGNIRLRIVVLGTKAIVLTRNGANIVAYVVDLSALTVAAGSNLRTDANGTSGLDAVAIAGTSFVICYSTSTTTTLYSYNAALTQLQTASVQVTTNAGCSIDGASGEVLYVSYFSAAGTIRMAIHDPSTLAQNVASFLVEDISATGGFVQLGTCRLDATHCVCAFSCVDTSGRTNSIRVTSGGSVDATTRRNTWGSRLASRPFVIGGKCYAFMLDYPLVTATAYPGANTMLYECEVSTNGGNAGAPHRFVGKQEHLIAGATATAQVPNVIALTFTSLYTCLPFQASVNATAANWRCGVRLVNVTQGASVPQDLWKTVTYGRESYIAGPLLAAYDGRSVFDYGYARAPVAFSMTSSSSGGAMVAGTYLYALVREYRSAAGVLHRSRTATLTQVVGGTSSSSVAGVFIGCNITLKEKLGSGFGGSTPCTELLALYRSTVGGTAYYRLTFEPGFNVVTVDPTARTQTLTDTRADASIDGAGTTLASRPQLYTAGGILDDDQPPAFVTMLLHKQRLWGLIGSRREVWYSKSFQDDFGTAPGFNASFRILFDDDITALAELAQYLVAFSAGRIWYVEGGDGPGPNGSGSDITNAIPIPSAVGCINPRSVVSVPAGVMFQATRGIYMLSQGLEVAFVGKQVQDQLAAFPNITSAVLVPRKNEVRFTCNNANGTAGIVLVFDYITGQWGRYEFWDADAAVASTPIADAILCNDVWTFVTPGGKVYSESDTTNLDNGATWVSMQWAIHSIGSGGLLGYQRVRRAYILGDRVTDTDLTLEFDFDDKGTYAQKEFWKSDDLANLMDGANIGARVGCQNGANPRCRAFAVRMTDAAPTGVGAVVGTGKGCTFSAIGMEIVPKPGMVRRAARARA